MRIIALLSTRITYLHSELCPLNRRQLFTWTRIFQSLYFPRIHQNHRRLVRYHWARVTTASSHIISDSSPINHPTDSVLKYSYTINEPEEANLAVQLLTCSREVACSNLARDTDWFDWESSWFTSIPPGECRTSTLIKPTIASFQILLNSFIVLLYSVS
jgi:hypothetical protein